MLELNASAMPFSVLSHFHQNFLLLQNLVLEVAVRPGTSNAANRHYDIRRCIRHIQGLLARDDFDLPIIGNGGANVDGKTSNCRSGLAEDPSNNTDEGQHDDADKRRTYYTQVTDDLTALLTLDFEAAVGDDASILQLIREALVPRILAILETAPSLTLPQLHLLLHHTLFLFERMNTSSKGANSSDASEIENSPNQAGVGHVLPLIKLFNRHVTNHEQLYMVISNDQELFVALHIVLHHYQQMKKHKRPASIPSPPPLALAILINCLLECLTCHFLAASDGEGSEDDADSQGRNDPDAIMYKDDNGEDLNMWLECRFLQEHEQTYESPSMLRGKVDAYVASLEQYGTDLIESTVRLLEDGSSSSQLAGGTTKSITDLSTHMSRQDRDEEDHDVTILKYAILATNFLVSMRSATFPLLHGGTSIAFAMSRSLWQEYINFLVYGLPNNHIKASGGVDAELAENCGGLSVNRSASADSETCPRSTEEEVTLAVAATDTLWRLAQLHYPIRSPSNSSSPGKTEDIPLITATILRLWEHANHYWNERTVNWIRYQLGHCFPHSSSAGTDLRHSLQAIILSYLFFPNTLDAAYPKEAVETLIELVVQEDNSQRPPNNGDEHADPWKGWILEQLSTDMGSFVTTSSM